MDDKWYLDAQNTKHIVDEEGFTVALVASESLAREIVHDHNAPHPVNQAVEIPVTDGTQPA